MNKHPHEPGHNVLQMPAMPLENRSPARPEGFDQTTFPVV